jgi:hypothetical protein
MWNERKFTEPANDVFQYYVRNSLGKAANKFRARLPFFIVLDPVSVLLPKHH